MPAGNSIIGDCAECCVCPDPVIITNSCARYYTVSDVSTFTPYDPFTDPPCPTDSNSSGFDPLVSITKYQRNYKYDPSCPQDDTINDIYCNTSAPDPCDKIYDGLYCEVNTQTFTGIIPYAYQFKFKIPNSRCLRLTWTERFISSSKVGLSSIEVISAGVYRPTVTLSAPPTGGTQARAIAVMSSTGTISSISITNPGSGYTSAPTVTVQSAINGGTSSTGWTATLTDGKVTAISGGSAGNYLPTLTISGGGGSATATAVMNDQGGMASITINTTDSNYSSSPSISVSSKISGQTNAILDFHLGQETQRCDTWNGITRSGKWVKRVVSESGHSLSSIEVVIPNDYLWTSTTTPTISITGGGGSGATAELVLTDGVVTSVNLTNLGSGYKTNPIISTSFGDVFGGPFFAAHFGTETEYDDNAQPTEALPLGYNSEDTECWLSLPAVTPFYYQFTQPSAGTMSIANIHAYCDCSSCPA